MNDQTRDARRAKARRLLDLLSDQSRKFADTVPDPRVRLALIAAAALAAAAAWWLA